jgi:hypothetical protein
MQGAREVLPLEGNGYCATAAVPRERTSSLAALFARIVRQAAPQPIDREWFEMVIAAARQADATGAHLLEADDAFGYGYRWPLLSE